MTNESQSSPLLGNRYQIQQTIGTGGMALVYKARDLMLERPVAIKILKQDYSRDPAFRERFRQEARAAANLSHPNIVTVHDFGYDTGKLFIVMEYVPGTDLKTMIKQRADFTIDEVIPLLVQACAGIGYAHRAGLVHCDVKPHNMLVTPDFALKVTDFGIARALSTIHPDEQSDIVWGSPQYLSPEQAAGVAPSPASDVYSLGVILYEMLTGRLPFQARDTAELVRMHRDAIPVPPRQINPNIPPALEQIVMKVLSKEPSARYRTADQLGRILVNFSHQADPFAAQIPAAAAQVPQAAIAVPSRPTSPPPINPANAQPVQNNAGQPAQHSSGLNFDWATIGLALLSLAAVGGLIPFWMYVIMTLSSQRP